MTGQLAIVPEALDYVQRAAYCQGKRLALLGIIPEHDREDVEQDIVMGILARMPSFDGRRGDIRPFIATLAWQRASAIVKSRRAKRRAPEQPALSLDDDGVAAWATPRCCDSPAWPDLEIDVRRVQGTLSPQLQELAEMLAHYTPGEVIDRLRIPRTSFYRRLAELRRHFASAGLDAYITPRPSLIPQCPGMGAARRPFISGRRAVRRARCVSTVASAGISHKSERPSAAGPP